MDKYYKTLELQKVLEMLAAHTSNAATRQMALDIRPSSDCEEVKREIEKVSQAFELSVRFGTPPFSDFHDVNGHLRRAKSGGRLSLKDLLEVLAVLKQIKSLHDWYKHCEDTETELDYLFNNLIPNDALLMKLENSILSEEELSDGASSELASIRRKIRQTGAKLRSTLDKMVKSSSMQKCLQDAVVTMRDGRYVLPVKSEYKGAVPGLVHDTSATGQTYFIEPMSIVDCNNDIRILESQEQEEIDRIIRALTAECALSADSISEGWRVCTILNLYFAKSNFAAKIKATAPVISDDGVIELKKARHPLIDPEKVVPVDISIGEEYNALIITGPNTGGKTVSLKTTGLLVLMTMCGLLIPCADGSRISVFDNILVDIGDNQSIEMNLSTFSSHINQVIDIISKADERSLILLDELGSGTDPVEGAALAVSVIERLKSSGAKLMVTTHYQELKIYAIESEDTLNASCEFNIETLKPTYKLIMGSPGKSNAFAICQSLGMPSDVIDEAKSLVSTENMRFEKVIENLEAARAELEKQNAELERLRREAEENAEKLRSELKELEDRKEAELDKARSISMNIIENTKAKSNELLDELQSIKKQKSKAKFENMVSDAERISKKSLNNMYDNANPVVKKKQTDDYKLPRALKTGDYVFIPSMNKNGTVVTNQDAKGFVFVQSGMMKMKMNITDLRLAEKPKEQKNNKAKFTPKKNTASRQVQQELDIRGFAADEGVMELDMFINHAVMTGLSLVTVIHGKGTGILRNAVHARLKKMPVVKSFRLGVYGEGEDGVTIVELKH
ncbi:endonuclease MutS2 [Ruminococcus sp. HUN007]|uniref:endonuclease MutS2 n=1 Tax=Ruminococcus sp. HUN007 TaxID=1514668 RepID=UPI0005D203B4|nr:endonuclease MutS2 [Ruminococcus sp. HUN007]